jgi:teichuronic acid biosynthesis glycosyltransferase TuaG|tara:strand:- start:1042 stop:1782 length:741 start_codon:yes stop_codon:yes gene_type:complete
MDLVSVILPYFKKKEFIEDSINSVLKQTYKNLEIIIIYDDTDRQDLSIIKKLKSYDHRINYILNVSNVGAGESRNIGIRHAKGKYISFLDADDIWNTNKMETQIKFMKKNDLKITHTTYEIIDKDEKITGLRRARNFNNVDELLKSCDIGLSTVMLKKEILSEECSFPSLKTKEDFVLWLKILQKKIKIISIDEKLVYWRKVDKSLSTSTIQKLKDGYKVYNYFMKFNFIKSSYYVFCLCFNFLKK